MLLTKDMEALSPKLKAFAMRLCGDPDKADDLVQETFLKALDHRASYQAGNLSAWLFTILRNTFYSECRRSRLEIQDVDGLKAEQICAPDNPEIIMCWKDFVCAWMSLPLVQQEALMLVGVEGVTYEAAAAILGVATGTVKSRVHRARSTLGEQSKDKV